MTQLSAISRNQWFMGSNLYPIAHPHADIVCVHVPQLLVRPPNRPSASPIHLGPIHFGESKERVRVASADKESAITRKMKRKKIFERGEIFLSRKRNTRPKWETSIIAVPQPYQPLNLMMYVVPPSPLTTVAASALPEAAVCCHAIPSPPTSAPPPS